MLSSERLKQRLPGKFCIVGIFLYIIYALYVTRWFYTEESLLCQKVKQVEAFS